MGRFLTFDLGAESGRAVLGTIENGKLELDLLHRFTNEPIKRGDSLHWNTLLQFEEIEKGLRACVEKGGAQLDAIGVDTWGVDYALLDENDYLVGEPYHYRDHRTNGVPEKVCEVIDPSEVYARTGIQFMQIN